jgi:protein tyrosine phosphatase
VTLFQYLDWPASAHPDTTSLLHFRRQVHEHLTSLESDGPALIHCHLTKRRSGTFLAIEFALTGRERTAHIDILGSVRWLRCQNPALISSPEQYHFIYELVEDCVLCGDTRIQVRVARWFIFKPQIASWRALEWKMLVYYMTLWNI